MDREVEVKIYYSSKTEPNGLVFYEEGIEYLKDEGIDVRVIDVSEEKEEAKKDGVISTPTVIIKKEGKIDRKHGAVSTLRGVLEKKDIKKDIKEFKK